MSELKSEAQAMCERLLAREQCDTANAWKVLTNPDGPEAAALIQKLLAERERMRSALEPFAKAADTYHSNQDEFELTLPRGPFFTKDCWPPSFKVGDFRKARSALSDGLQAGA